MSRREPIWLLSTKDRPYACQGVLDACERTGMSSAGVVYVDGCEYPDLRLPANWTKIEGPWGGIRAGMDWVLREYPQASSYGWLADDTYPQTDGWDKLMEEAAGDWRLASCRDNWLSENFQSRKWLLSGGDLGGGVCWGGDLVREVGWWAPPELKQGGIDFVWTTLLHNTNHTRYLEDVTVEHRHWHSGARARDGTDLMPHVQEDVSKAFAYVESAEFQEIRAGLIRALDSHSDDHG